MTSCDPDGLVQTTEQCALGCVPADAATPDHCGVIRSAYLATTSAADICKTPATAAEYRIAADTTLDTGQDAQCTGGVVTQTAGPAICVVRAKTILIGKVLRVVGPRAVALVADSAITVQQLGVIDVSATGRTDGPGGGTIESGVTNAAGGGGGAAFQANGAPGGSTVDGGGSIGGSAFTPGPTTTHLIGGPHSSPPTPTQIMFGAQKGGGGGGALLLVACKGTVSLAGRLSANGGGGGYGQCNLATYSGGAGGGAGGYIAIEAGSINLTGSIYANGGGGGAGCSAVPCTGNAGEDGRNSLTVASGGAGMGTGGSGGAGGTYTIAPGVGKASPDFGAGGGGGAQGWVHYRTPVGATNTLTPSQVSPDLTQGTWAFPVE